MNWLDILIIVVLVVSCVGGLKTGLIKAVLTLAGLIVGIILAGRFYIALAEQLTLIPQENWAKIAAFAIILIVVMIIAGVLAGLLKWAAKAIMLGWVDRLGGAIFGLVWSATLWSAILAIWVKSLGTATITESALANILLDYFPLVLALLPDEFDTIRSLFQ